MDQGEMNERFSQIVGAEAAGEMVNQVIVQLGTAYKGALAAGFPEQRAWELVNKLIDKAFDSIAPMVEKYMRDGM